MQYLFYFGYKQVAPTGHMKIMFERPVLQFKFYIMNSRAFPTFFTCLPAGRFFIYNSSFPFTF